MGDSMDKLFSLTPEKEAALCEDMNEIGSYIFKRLGETIKKNVDEPSFELVVYLLALLVGRAVDYSVLELEEMNPEDKGIKKAVWSYFLTTLFRLSPSPETLFGEQFKSIKDLLALAMTPTEGLPSA